jgi:hypothetical protein
MDASPEITPIPAPDEPANEALEPLYKLYLETGLEPALRDAPLEAVEQLYNLEIEPLPDQEIKSPPALRAGVLGAAPDEPAPEALQQEPLYEKYAGGTFAPWGGWARLCWLRYLHSPQLLGRPLELG